MRKREFAPGVSLEECIITLIFCRQKILIFMHIFGYCKLLTFFGYGVDRGPFRHVCNFILFIQIPVSNFNVKELIYDDIRILFSTDTLSIQFMGLFKQLNGLRSIVLKYDVNIIVGPFRKVLHLLYADIQCKRQNCFSPKSTTKCSTKLSQ